MAIMLQGLILNCLQISDSTLVYVVIFFGSEPCPTVLSLVINIFEGKLENEHNGIDLPNTKLQRSTKI